MDLTNYKLPLLALLSHVDVMTNYKQCLLALLSPTKVTNYELCMPALLPPVELSILRTMHALAIVSY